MMMNNTINSILLATTLLLSSCAQEPLEQPALGAGDLQIQLSLSGTTPSVGSRAAGDVPGTPEEDAIHSMHLLFYSTARTPEKIYYIDSSTAIIGPDIIWNRETKTLTLRNITFLSNDYKVYALVNDKEDAAYYNTKTQQDLKKEHVTKTDLVQIPLPTLTKGVPMSGSTDWNLTTTKKLTIPLIRQLAKLEVSIKIDPIFAVTYPDIEWANSKHDNPKPLTVQVYNMYKHRFILPEYETSVASKEFLTLNETTLLRHDGDWPLATMLVHDNKVIESPTYLVINMPYYNTTTKKKVDNNYYRIDLREQKGGQIMIARNTVYQITATLQGFGTPNNPGVDGTLVLVDAKPWEEYPVDGDIDEPITLNLSERETVDFINMNSATLAFSSNQQLDNIEVENAAKYTTTTNQEGIACLVDDYFSDLTGKHSPKIALNPITGQGLITLTARGGTDGYEPDMESIILTLNANGVKKSVKVSFRYVIDISPAGTRNSYNGLKGLLEDGGNGVSMDINAASNDNTEPPYRRFEVARQNTTATSWAAARTECSARAGWRAPRIREILRIVDNNDGSHRLNCTGYGTTLSSATQVGTAPSFHYYTSPAAWNRVADSKQNESFRPTRCVREIQ